MPKYKVYQDGGQFYVDTLIHPDFDGNCPIADYGFMVVDDSDTDAASPPASNS